MITAFTWLWRSVFSLLDFLSLLEDERLGAPRRLSQTRVMVWGAMVVGAIIILSVNLNGSELSLTETGLIGLLTVAAGLMKFARDGRRSDDAQDDPLDDPLS